jgi:subtilisin family serine protease
MKIPGKLFSVLGFLICTAVATRATAAQTSSKISPSLLKAFDRSEAPGVFINLKETADLSGATRLQGRTERVRYVYDQLRLTALRTQAHLLSILNAQHRSYQSFYLINAVRVSGISRGEADALAKLPEVASIDLDARMVRKEPQADLLGLLMRNKSVNPDDIEGAMKAIGVDQVWNDLGIFGKGIVVASGDGGVFWKHPALMAHYRGYSASGVSHDYNWHDSIRQAIPPNTGTNPCSFDSVEPCDEDGHGTHTVGTMVGDDGGTNHIGVAPQAQWIGCRNMDRDVGMASTYLECFEFFLAPYVHGADPKTQGRPDLAPHIINNSWSCPQEEGCSGGEFLDAVRALSAAGILVVVAAGNEGPDCGTVGSAPGTYSGDVLSVGAFDSETGDAASFSSRGPSVFDNGLAPNISAPGMAILSSVPKDGMSDDGLYDIKSGTSMASPHVAGVAALLWSAKPALIGKVKDTIALLEQTAKPTTSDQTCGPFPGDKIPNAVFGYGKLDAYAAVKSVLGLK